MNYQKFERDKYAKKHYDKHDAGTLLLKSGKSFVSHQASPTSYLDDFWPIGRYETYTRRLIKHMVWVIDTEMISRYNPAPRPMV